MTGTFVSAFITFIKHKSWDSLHCTQRIFTIYKQQRVINILCLDPHMLNEILLFIMQYWRFSKSFVFGTKYFAADECTCICTIKHHILEEFLVHCII